MGDPKSPDLPFVDAPKINDSKQLQENKGYHNLEMLVNRRVVFPAKTRFLQFPTEVLITESYQRFHDCRPRGLDFVLCSHGMVTVGENSEDRGAASAHR